MATGFRNRKHGHFRMQIALKSKASNFEQINCKVYTQLLLQQVWANPQLWNQNPERKIGVDSPHSEMSDIWVRFRPKNELTSVESYAEPHTPEWYPSRRVLTEVERISLDMMALFRAVQLGGVLITKIPSGGSIKPHDDRGRWHPEFFNTKVYIPLQSNSGCINTCEDDSVNMTAGHAWTFDNLKTHSVVNNGDTDRITLIISMRTEP